MGQHAHLPSNWQQPTIIGDYLQWQYDRGLRDRTRERNASVLNWLALWLLVTHGVQLEGATHEVLLEWRRGLTVSESSIRSYVSSVRCFYQWAARSGLIPRDPAWQIPKPRARRGRPRPIGKSPLLLAIEAAIGTVHIWLILAAYAGLRASDIAGLRREDIFDDDDRPYILIGDYSKGGHHRNVPLSPYVLAELTAYGLPARGALFRMRNGRQVSAKYVSNACNEYLHGLGIVETLHQLRHRFATDAQRSPGSDIVTLQHIMGHEDLATTALYTEPTSEVAHAMVAAIQPAEWRSQASNG